MPLSSLISTNALLASASIEWHNLMANFPALIPQLCITGSILKVRS